MVTRRSGDGPEPVDDAPALREPLKIGRYVAFDKLGEGGMGVVLSGYDAGLDRKVAIKLLRRGGADDGPGRARLLREAQSMARLSHPNVVQVYDVGEFHGQVFLALEFVHGVTLRTWLQAQPRSWQEIRDVFVQAGRGLAAAHAAGVIHRDFKPENVLIDRDGRVRVADFGLARPLEDPRGAGGPGDGPPAAPLDALTATGAVVGTPAYMSPEQMLRLPVDARCDQFSFCLALYEALHGQRPFRGANLRELSRNILAGRIAAPPSPSPSRAPPWLHAAALRGLDPRPEQRYPAMDALLRALTPATSQLRWRRWLAGALGLAAGGAIYATAASEEACQGAGAALTGIWDTERRRETEQALLSTALPFSADTWVRVRDGLDAYTATWVAARGEACQARHGLAPSNTRPDLRLACLDRRLGEVAALIEVLASADQTTVAHAAQAVRALRPVAECDDATALLAEGQWFGAAAGPAQAAERPGLLRALAEAQALELAGQVDRGLARTEALLRELAASEDHRLRAEVLYTRGLLLEQSGAAAQAEAALWQAYVQALRAGDEPLQARALVRDFYVRTVGLRDLEGAERAAEIAGALVARAAPESKLEGDLRNNLGVLRVFQSRAEEADALLFEGLELRRRVLPPQHTDIGASLSNIGVFLDDVRRSGEAVDFLAAAMQHMRGTLGPRHPTTLQVEGNLGIALAHNGERTAAREVLDRVLAELVPQLGPKHPALAGYYRTFGELLVADDRVAEGIATLERAAEVAELGGDVGLRGVMRFALAKALWDQEIDRDRALALARQAEADSLAGVTDLRESVRAWLRARAPA